MSDYQVCSATIVEWTDYDTPNNAIEVSAVLHNATRNPEARLLAQHIISKGLKDKDEYDHYLQHVIEGLVTVGTAECKTI